MAWMCFSTKWYSDVPGARSTKDGETGNEDNSGFARFLNLTNMCFFFKVYTLIDISSNTKQSKWLLPVSGANWRKGARGGAVAPKIPPKKFSLDSLMQCSIYVHACQALVNFSTWIDFNEGCWYRAFGITAQKNFPYASKIFAPSPRNLWNWRHCFPFFSLVRICRPFLFSLGLLIPMYVIV